MKKVLFLLTLTAMVLALCLTLAACGEETPATSAPATTTAAIASTPAATAPESAPAATEPVMTSAVLTEAPATTPVTTPTVTTAPETEPEFVPEMPAKIGISYSYFFSGFMYTTMDENSLTLKRELYKVATMQMSDNPLAFYYEYDENGKLTGYTANIYGDMTVGAVTWEDDLTATITDTASGAVIRRIVFDADGWMDEEIWLENGTEIFIFDYEEDGRLYFETIPGDMEMTVVSTYEDNVATVLFEVMYTEVARFEIEYSDAGYPYTVANTTAGREAYYSYEYDKYNRCIEASAAEDGYEDIYYYTYDNQGRVGKVEIEDDYGIREMVYTYNDKNLKIRLAVTSKSHSGEIEDFYVTTHEYDENGRRIKTVDYENGDEESHISTWTYCFTYDDSGNLIQETADYRQADGGFIASFKDTYEYDELGREIKFTMVEYQKNGSVLDTTVTESIYNEEGSLVKTIRSYYNAAGKLVDQTTEEY